MHLLIVYGRVSDRVPDQDWNPCNDAQNRISRPPPPSKKKKSCSQHVVPGLAVPLWPDLRQGQFKFW